MNIQWKNILSHPLSLICLGLLPCFVVLSYTQTAKRNLASMGEDALYLYKKNHALEAKHHKELQLQKQLKNCDPGFTTSQLESLTFLSSEIQKQKALLLANPEQQNVKMRLQFLENGANRLRFREQNFQRLGKMQEVELVQQNPVEMDQEDLKKLLAKIENISIGSHKPGENPPDLLIKNFELIKKPHPLGDETFLVQVECIKRELAHE